MSDIRTWEDDMQDLERDRDKLYHSVKYLTDVGRELKGNGCEHEYIADALSLGLELISAGLDLTKHELASDDFDAVWVEK